MVHSEHNVDESLSVLRMGRHQRDDLIQKIEDTVCRITTPFRTNNGFGKIIKLEKISRGYMSHLYIRHESGKIWDQKNIIFL